MIGRGRLVLNDPSCADVRGIFSVENNGWVTQWRDDLPEHVEAMFPPTAVLVLAFSDVPASDEERGR